MGKEVCDLLVVCGRHVLIFSDKFAAYPHSGDAETDWRRWYARTIGKARKQLDGAERWIKEHPERLFTDPTCSQLLPIEFPPASTLELHKVIVARGARSRCQEWFGGGSGSLIFTADCHGAERPFTVGDLDPSGSFIHVLDDTTLDVLFSELSTVSDFVNYLEKKERFIRAYPYISVAGEEELLAIYLTRLNPGKEHDIVLPCDNHEPLMGLSILEGFWDDIRGDSKFIRKKMDDDVSYMWDKLITTFTKHLLAGTSTHEPAGVPISEHERGVRYMALLTRIERRMIARTLSEAIAAAPSDKILTRSFKFGSDAPSKETGFVFVQIPKPDFIESYAEYRKARREYLYRYCFGFAERNRDLKRVIGIATEPPLWSVNQGISEDLCYFEADQWSSQMVKEARRECRELGILRPNRLTSYAALEKEYRD